MDSYGKGVLYVLTIPGNFNDLYRLPQGVLTALRSYIGEDLPETMDAPSQVSLMEYDNNTFVVQSFRDEPVTVTVSVKGSAKDLRDMVTSEMVKASAPPAGAQRWGNRGTPGAEQRTSFQIKVQPHSFEAFTVAGTQ